MKEMDINSPNGSMNKTPLGAAVKAHPTDLHTEDLQEIITKVPSWIVRWGILLFFCILLMFVAISVFVRYPDTIKQNIKLETNNVSPAVMATTAGRIIKLSVKQGDVVKRGQPLAVIAISGIKGEGYMLTAPQDGKIGFTGIVQQGTFIKPNQEVFIIYPAQEAFFGIMQIPANNINKIKTGQQVLIKVRNYPAEVYGQLKGIISYKADEPTKDGFFTIKVTLDNSGIRHKFAFKSWMTGDAEIITESVSLQSRVLKTVFNRLY